MSCMMRREGLGSALVSFFFFFSSAWARFWAAGHAFGQQGARLRRGSGDAGLELLISALPMHFD